MEFIDRQTDIGRLRRALRRERSQFIVIYGRRRIGKSTLIGKIADPARDIYFLADDNTAPYQRQLFAQTVATVMPDFDGPVYPDWETLLLALNGRTSQRFMLCLDEFPNLVRSCPSLPSTLQRLIDSKALRFDLIICGSSQQMMQGFVLDSREPLYGRADEIIRLQPIPARYVPQALRCDAVQAISEYALWGGVPRYWELRNDYDNLDEAIAGLLLDPHGPLYDEPARLLRDEMRDTTQASTLLAVIGNGANRLSEIASRVGRQATDITAPLSRLRELGFIRKRTPFGEEPRKSRKSIYTIADPLLRSHFRFVQPYRSIIEIGRGQTVMQIYEQQRSNFEAATWEELCRDYITGNTIDGITYNAAEGWWGEYYDEAEGAYCKGELDIVAESLDRRHLLIGECKWTEGEDAARLIARLSRIAPGLPFAKQHDIHLALFLRREPHNANAARIFYPRDVLSVE